MMFDDSIGRKYAADKWSKPYDMIVRRHHLHLGLNLTEVVVVGLWTDPAGRRRRTELVRLGCAHSVEQAIGHATLGMLRHPEGTRKHKRYRDWSDRLLATQRVIARTDAKYRRMVAEMATGLPYREPERPVAVLRAGIGAGRGDDDRPPAA